MNARLAAIAALVVIALAYNLSGYPLLDPDEGRNAEVAREMAATGDYIHPRLDGLPYPDKPVLFYAVTALFVRALGPAELAVRIPPLLFTLATLALVWWVGTRWFGKEGGWVAVIAAAASPLTLGFAHTVIMDSALTFFVTGAIVLFAEAVGRYGGTAVTDPLGQTTALPPYRLTALAWISLALGVVTKGPIALALPFMVVLPYAIWQKRARALFDVVGVLAFAAILLPWLRTMSDFAPGFLRHAIVTETFLRLTTPALERTGPWWYFLPIMVAGAVPWSIVIAKPLWDLVRRTGGPADRRTVLLAIWILVPLLFFSLSQSKRPQYVLPLVTPIALLVGGFWAASARPPVRRSAQPAAVTLAFLGAVLVFFHSPLLRLIRNLPPAVMEASHTPSYWLGAICIGCGVVAWRWGTRLDVRMLALSLPLVSIPFVGATLLREIGRDRSAVELARAIREHAPPDTEVVGVQAFPLSLPYYLGRTVTLATADGRELTSNYLSRSLDIWRGVPGSPLRPVDWWREAFVTCERPRVFVVRATDSEARALLSGRLPQLAESRKYAVYGPCGRADLAGRTGDQTGRRADLAGVRPSARPPVRPS